MHVAYFSPLNPQSTGIADYSEELLLHLARHVDLDLFIDDYHPSNPSILERFEVFSYRDFAALAGQRHYDVCLYHMGNNPAHEYIYHCLLRYPGITVLHDHVLHSFFAAITLGQGQPSAYVREMGYCYGWQGCQMAHRVMHHMRTLQDYDYPLVDRVIDASLGIIVHSEYVRSLVSRSHPNTPVTKVNHHLSLKTAAGDHPSRSQIRASLGLRDDQFVVASFGRVAPQKRVRVALRAFAHLRRESPEAVYLLVGETNPLYDLEPLVSDLGLEQSVVRTGYVELDDFLRYMTIADVCINLRYPSAGETSGSLIRAMGTGKPVIVSDVGAFAELPDDCCLKVGVGPEEEGTLLTYLSALGRDHALRQRLGHNAQRYVQIHHRIEDSARGYVAFIERCLESIERPSYPPLRFSMRRTGGRALDGQSR